MAGECEVWMESASASCGISWATVGGGDEAHSNHAGSGDGKRRLKWGGHWCNHSAREGGARWWWIGVV